MTTPTLREAAENAADVLDEARSYTSSESWSPSMTEECDRAIRLLHEALAAQPVADAVPLFLLHCGQIDSGGEQDEWDCEADSGKRVDEFCRQHPGKTIPLYAGAAPVAREAEPLTDERILNIAKTVPALGTCEEECLNFARRLLYAAAHPQQPARVPLTNAKDRQDQGSSYVDGYGYVDTRALRAIEAAYGIRQT